jgi:hypothetical protein
MLLGRHGLCRRWRPAQPVAWSYHYLYPRAQQALAPCTRRKRAGPPAPPVAWSYHYLYPRAQQALAPCTRRKRARPPAPPVGCLTPPNPP